MDRLCLYVGEDPQAMSQLSSMATPLELTFEHCRRVGELQNLSKSVLAGVIVTEPKLRDGGWRDVIDVAQRMGNIQVIVTSDRPTVHFWADALEAGAYDILTQPFRTSEVQRLLLSAWLRHDRDQLQPKRSIAPAALRAAV